MSCIAVIELGEGRKFLCHSLDLAKQAWAESFSENLKALIDVYPPAGKVGIVATYRYDPDVADWVRAS